MNTEQIEIKLAEFFRSDAGGTMGRYGDSMGWTAIQTAKYFGIPLDAITQPAAADARDAARYQQARIQLQWTEHRDRKLTEAEVDALMDAKIAALTGATP